MSAPPEYRGAPAQGPTSGGGVAWPISSDTGLRVPRTDVLAALATIIGGAAALGQLFLTWSSIVPGVGLQDPDGGVTGWERYLAARAGAALSFSDTVTAYSVIGSALAGGALVLLGLAMLLPLDHRPLGAVALALSILAFAAVVWWLVAGHQTFNQSVGDLFAHAGPGWYLFLIGGPVALLGSIKALATG
jgi:hypothetical protein